MAQPVAREALDDSLDVVRVLVHDRHSAALISALRMTSLQRAISDLMVASSSSGVLGLTDRLNSAKRFCSSGASSARRTSALRRCTISRGVAFGATRLHQLPLSAPLTPRPARVDTSVP